jgi:hypothetical protein
MDTKGKRKNRGKQKKGFLSTDGKDKKRASRATDGKKKERVIQSRIVDRRGV